MKISIAALFSAIRKGITFIFLFIKPILSFSQQAFDGDVFKNFVFDP